MRIQELLIYEAVTNEILEKTVMENLGQLTEMYENISTAVTVVEGLLEKTELNTEEKHNLRVLLILNLGQIFNKNIIKIKEYIEWHKRNYDDFDLIWEEEERLTELERLTKNIESFYAKVSNLLDWN